MTAEAEVCNGVASEMAGVEEKHEFKVRSFQDLAKPELNGIGNHDQADDPEDSYVLVTDVGNPSADGKDDMAAVDGSPRYESSAPGELSLAELGVNVGKLENAEVGDVAVDGSPQHKSGAPGEILVTELNAPDGNPEGANVGKHTLVNGSPDVQVISIVVGGGNQDNTVEEENRCLEELNDQHGKINIMNGDTLREGGTGNAGSTKKNPSVEDVVVVGVEASVRYEDEIQDKLDVGKLDCEAESVIKKAEDSNGKIERSEEAEVANKLAVSQPEGEAESEIKKACDSNGKIERSEEYEVASKLTIIEPEFEAESGIKKAEANRKGERSEETEVANKLAISKPECQAEPEIKKAEGSNGKIERPEEADVANKLAGDKPGCESESEIKKAEESKGKIERSEEAEVVKFEDQDGKIGVVAVTGPDSVEENQECEVPILGLVADSGQEDGLKNLLSPSGKLEAVKDEAESALGKEAMEAQKCDIDSKNDAQKCDIDSENDVQNGLDEDKVVESAADCNVGTACGKVSEGKDGGIFSVSHVQGSNMYPDGAVNSRDGNGATPQIDVSEREAEASGPSQKQPVVHKPENEVQISDAETAEVVSSLSVDGSESENFGNEPIYLDSLEKCTISGGSDSTIRTVVSNEMEPISQGGELSVDSEDDQNPPVSAVKLEPEAHNSSPVDHVAVTSEKDGTKGSEVLDSFASDKGVSNSMPEPADVKAMVGGATRSDDETLLLAKNGDTGNSCDLDKSKASPESCSDTVTKGGVSGVALIKPFNFFVRLPRYSDEKLQEQIKIAEQEVNDKTKLRDSIQAQIQEIRVKNQNNGIDYEYAKGEDRSLKKLLKEKRMEIDSLQSVINKAKNATYIEDLNSRIKTIEHMIQHETLPLKEEKQLIIEIKQLKQLRGQLSSCKCSQNEIQQVLEQREQAEERLKTLRKELGNIKKTASKAQTACDEAESKYNGEYKKVKELQAQFRAANDVRQEAYAKFLSLSKELSQKRKNFFKIKNNSAAATDYAFTDDRKALYRHCVNEVENFMELWNGDAEFRSEYVRLNTRSTLRRFGTLDGRSLGPDEKPIILPSYVSERNDKLVSVQAQADSISKTPIIELKPETKIEIVSSDIHSSKNETESNAKTLTTGGPAKSKQVNSLVPVSGMDDKKVVEVQEEPVKTKEEELELVRKAEEIRREEAEAKLKERRRLEEIVKAKEACERKKRRDEKAQKREELKAKKEAEQKEKEREKKSRKKERRKAASTSTSAPMDIQDDASSMTCVETSKEDASTKVSDGSTKKPKTSRVMASKQNKTRSAPPPSLRNRNSRKWQQWMWLILISIAVLVLFWLGNLGVFSSVNSKLQGSAGF